MFESLVLQTDSHDDWILACRKIRRRAKVVDAEHFSISDNVCTAPSVQIERAECCTISMSCRTCVHMKSQSRSWLWTRFPTTNTYVRFIVSSMCWNVTQIFKGALTYRCVFIVSRSRRIDSSYLDLQSSYGKITRLQNRSKCHTRLNLIVISNLENCPIFHLIRVQFGNCYK